MDGKQDATGVKPEDDEEAQEKKKLGLEQQWQERMNGIRECMFQEGPLFQVLSDTSTCIDVPFPPLPSHWSLPCASLPASTIQPLDYPAGAFLGLLRALLPTYGAAIC